jgi:hypothetical protein
VRDSVPEQGIEYADYLACLPEEPTFSDVELDELRQVGIVNNPKAGWYYGDEPKGRKPKP